MAKNKPQEEVKEETVVNEQVDTVVSAQEKEKKPETVEVNKVQLDALIASIEDLKKKDEENQNKLKMLYDVADKGRVMNYESKNFSKKPFKVFLSKYNGGIITSWQVLKDELITHPVTGAKVGESQEIKVTLLNPDGTTLDKIFLNYPAFSDARYNERIECEVTGKEEDFEGRLIFKLQLPNGTILKQDARFVN